MENLIECVEKTTVVVRGGGDLATGVIQKLWHAGFKVIILETAIPLAIRQTVSLCPAIYKGSMQVEDLKAVRIESLSECGKIWAQDAIPMIVDPEGKSISQMKPTIVVDAILAKRNIGTSADMASIVVALGPGFSAPEDADVVIETMRGHTLGQLIFEGATIPNTGIPGVVGGKSAERVVHAPAGGVTHRVAHIGDVVKKGDTIFYVDETPVPSPLDGIVRGLISDGIKIPKGLKSADVDPRSKDDVDYLSISDKARALGGAVLDAIFVSARKV